MPSRPQPHPERGLHADRQDEGPRRLHVVGADDYPDWESVYGDNVERLST
jgi:hypothetical protein